VTDLLLQTKLYAPPLRPSVVHRTRLIEKLNAGLNASSAGFASKLTLVSAPAGFGKTTIVSDWLQQKVEIRNQKAEEATLLPSAFRLLPLEFAWLSLDAADSDPARFWQYVVAAMQTVAPEIGASLPEPGEAANVTVWLTGLLNDVDQCKRPFLLILDDYHEINSPAVHDTIAFWLEHMPTTMHLVMTTRTDPPFSVARWRVRGQLTEIGPIDLRFTEAETAVFCQQAANLFLSQDNIVALEERTEGWIAGLQLALLSMSQLDKAAQAQFIAEFSGDNRALVDYLGDEILDQQPEHVRDFLLQTAVLDRFSAELCDEVLQTEQSQVILEQLELANLFLVPLDSQRRWFRYHHLFADFLRHRLQQKWPKRVAGLHQRAAGWFAGQGWQNEAIDHALVAEDYEMAMQLMADVAEKTVVRGNATKLLHWIDRLPAAYQFKQPLLTLYQAWALFFSGQLAQVEPCLEKVLALQSDSELPLIAYVAVLRSFMAKQEGHADEAIALAKKARSGIAQSLENNSNDIMLGAVMINLADIHAYLGNFEEAIPLYQEAIHLNQESGNVLAALGAVRVLGDLMRGQGRLHRAEEVYAQGLRMTQLWRDPSSAQSPPLVAAAPIHAGLGMVHLAWNELAQAESYLEEAVSLYEFGGMMNLAEGLAALAELRLAQGDTEGVLRIIERLRDEVNRVADLYTQERIEAAIVVLQVRLWRQAGMDYLQAEVTHWLAENPANGDAMVHYGHEFLPEAQSRVLLALGRGYEALPLLNNLSEKAEASGRTGQWLTRQVWLALAYEQMGKTAVADQTLAQALKTAEPEGYIRVFVDEGVVLAAMLQRQKAEGRSQIAYFDKLFNAFPQSLFSHLQSQESLVEPLSERELEVVKLMADGATNQQIADELVVAKSTAKKHVSNIIGKLGVENRTTAVARARELNLL